MESSESIKKLLNGLKNNQIVDELMNNLTSNNDEEEDKFYVDGFYIDQDNVYLEVISEESACKSVFVYQKDVDQWEQIDPVPVRVLKNVNLGNVGNILQLDIEDDNDLEQNPGAKIDEEVYKMELFKFSQSKQNIIDDIGQSIQNLDNKDHSNKVEYESLDSLEQRLMLYERLEHKVEYFITLETYLLKLVTKGDVERIGKIVSKYDIQYGVHKKLKFDSAGHDEFFLGMKKTRILEDFIKPKIKMNAQVYKRVFK